MTVADMGTIFLTGIIQNGQPRAILVPVNPRQPVHITKGNTTTLQLRVILPTGVAVDLTGATLVLSVKQNSDDSNAAVTLAGTLDAVPTTGKASFAISSATFRYQDPGRYVYDVWLTIGSTREAIIPLSPLFLEPTVTAVP